VAKTLDDVVSEARLMLQDRRVPYRYTQADLASAVNTAMRELKRLRPDVFLSYDPENPITLPNYVEADIGALPAKAFPIDEIFFQAIVFHVVGKLQLGDDEFAVDNRAMTLLAAFRQQLVGG
jgi:hypothetical protein